MRFIEACVHFLHTLIIWAICNRIINNQHCTISIIILEIFLTLCSAYLSKSSRKYVMLQIILSVSLSNNLVMHKSYRLSWIYFFKSFHMYRLYHKIKKSSFVKDIQFLQLIFEYFWSSVLFFLFLKLTGLVYCSYFVQESCPIGEQFVILYQFMVTGTSVGFGDHVPRSKQQIYFFIFSIPFLCTSFSIYVSKLIDIYKKLNNYYEEDQNQHSINEK